MFVSILFLGKTIYAFQLLFWYNLVKSIILNIAFSSLEIAQVPHLYTCTKFIQFRKKSLKKELYPPKNRVLIKIASVACVRTELIFPSN